MGKLFCCAAEKTWKVKIPGFFQGPQPFPEAPVLWDPGTSGAPCSAVPGSPQSSWQEQGCCLHSPAQVILAWRGWRNGLLSPQRAQARRHGGLTADTSVSTLRGLPSAFWRVGLGGGRAGLLRSRWLDARGPNNPKSPSLDFQLRGTIYLVKVGFCYVQSIYILWVRKGGC